MKVYYRVIQEINLAETWEVVGVVIFWPDAPPHMQLRSLVQHTISGPIWHNIRQIAEIEHLTLKTYHCALHEFEQQYRLLPDVHQFEADTAQEIRQTLRQKYVFASGSATQPPLEKVSSRIPI